jgi:hypothetical protein
LIHTRSRGAAFFAIIVVALSACVSSPPQAEDKSSGLTLNSADGKMRLTLPAHWDSHDFHLDAVRIGAAREGEGEYVQIISDSRDQYVNDLKQYTDGKMETMVVMLQGAKLTADGGMDIHGRRAIRYEIEGKLPDSGLKIGYVLTVIETKDDYIQVVSWCPGTKFAEHRGELQGLADGFEPVGETP